MRVEQGGFEPEPAVHAGAAEYGAALGEEGAADVGDALVGCAAGAEEDGAEGGGVVEVEAGVGVKGGCELLGLVADLVDEGAESGAAEGFEGDGDFEDVGASGGAQGAAEEVGQTGFGVVVGVEVVGVVGEGVRSAGLRTARRPAATGCQPSLWRSRVTVAARSRPVSWVRRVGLKRSPAP